MFELTADGVYQSSLLRGVPRVRHGFATRGAAGWPGDYTRVKQIHSHFVEIADGRSGCLGQGDALVSADPGKWIGIRTADCVPILIAAAGGGAVAAVHAGWRGTVARIAARAVDRLKAAYGLMGTDLVAAVGPCIGECCFEVGPEVSEQFGNREARRLDLAAANKRQLIDAGVPQSQVDVSGLCTMCDGERFESYRRDRDKSGRMVAAIGIFEK